jgi:MFS family permease
VEYRAGTDEGDQVWRVDGTPAGLGGVDLLVGHGNPRSAAVLFFLAGSVLCGIASSLTMLVASRTLQGVGGGAIMVTATAVIGEVIPLRERGRYQGGRHRAITNSGKAS